MSTPGPPPSGVVQKVTTVSPSGDVAVHPTSAWVAGSGLFSTREDAHP